MCSDKYFYLDRFVSSVRLVFLKPCSKAFVYSVRSVFLKLCTFQHVHVFNIIRVFVRSFRRSLSKACWSMFLWSFKALFLHLWRPDVLLVISSRIHNPVTRFHSGHFRAVLSTLLHDATSILVIPTRILSSIWRRYSGHLIVFSTLFQDGILAIPSPILEGRSSGHSLPCSQTCSRKVFWPIPNRTLKSVPGPRQTNKLLKQSWLPAFWKKNPKHTRD